MRPPCRSASPPGSEPRDLREARDDVSVVTVSRPATSPPHRWRARCSSRSGARSTARNRRVRPLGGRAAPAAIPLGRAAHAAAIAPAASIGSTLRRARQRMKPLRARRSRRGRGRGRRGARSGPRSTARRRAAVARRRSSSVLATSSATVAIGQASCKSVASRVSAAPANTARTDSSVRRAPRRRRRSPAPGRRRRRNGSPRRRAAACRRGSGGRASRTAPRPRRRPA